MITDMLKRQASGAMDATVSGLKTVGDKAGEGLATVRDKTSEGLKTVGEKAGDGLATVRDKTGEGFKNMGNTFAGGEPQSSLRSRSCSRFCSYSHRLAPGLLAK